jgi:hypothetical protein
MLCIARRPRVVGAEYSGAIDAHLLFLDCSVVLVIYENLTRVKMFPTRYRKQACALSPSGETLAVFGVTRKRMGPVMVRTVLVSFFSLIGDDYTLLYACRIGDLDTNSVGDLTASSYAVVWSADGHSVAVAAGWHIEVLQFATQRRTRPTLALAGSVSGHNGERMQIKFVVPFSASMAVLMSCGSNYCIASGSSQCHVNVSSFVDGLSQISPLGNRLVGRARCTPTLPTGGIQIVDTVSLARVTCPMPTPVAGAGVSTCDVRRVQWSPDQADLAVLFTDGSLRVYTGTALQQWACTVLPHSVCMFAWDGVDCLRVVTRDARDCTQLLSLRRGLPNAIRRALLLGNHARNSACVLARLPGDILQLIMALV